MGHVRLDIDYRIDIIFYVVGIFGSIAVLGYTLPQIFRYTLPTLFS